MNYIKIIGFVVPVALFCTPMVSACDRPEDSELKAAYASLEIDPTGRIAAMEWLNPLGEGEAKQLREHVLALSFEPAQRSGRKVASRTHLTLYYRCVTTRAIGAGLELVSFDSGPIALERSGILYPARAIERRIEGLVVVQATVEPDGSTSDVHAAKQWPAIPLLSGVAVRAVETWRFEPDAVDGSPIASDVLIPIQFCIERCRVRPLSAHVREMMSSNLSASDADGEDVLALPVLSRVEVVATKLGGTDGKRRRGPRRENRW